MNGPRKSLRDLPLPSREIRTGAGNVELRADDTAGGKPKLAGYAAKFDQPFEWRDWWGWTIREFIRPGAFADVLEDDVRALKNHDPNILLGRNRNGSLKLTQDQVGLFYEATPPDTRAAQDTVIEVREGLITGSSFAFEVKEQRFTEDKEAKLETREILKLKRLHDVSPVTYPAYKSTDAFVRSQWTEPPGETRESPAAADPAQAGGPPGQVAPTADELRFQAEAEHRRRALDLEEIH